MTLKQNSTFLHFGVAIIAAPIAVLIFLKLFGSYISNTQINSNLIFYLLIFFPIIEEFTFRGFLLELLNYMFNNKKLFAKISIANILTSILFVLMHTIHYPLYWAVLTFFPSIIFGYFKERFNNIVPSILLHSYYNFVFLFIMNVPKFTF